MMEDGPFRHTEELQQPGDIPSEEGAKSDQGVRKRNKMQDRFTHKTQVSTLI